jgi:hypothetical protein
MVIGKPRPNRAEMLVLVGALISISGIMQGLSLWLSSTLGGVKS